MSGESWREEFYPTPASESAGSDLEAARHSLRKWQGSTEENLQRHGLERAPIACGVATCALCHRYYEKGCRRCPLKRTMGEKCGDPGSPYQQALDGRPRALIKALQATVDRLAR